MTQENHSEWERFDGHYTTIRASLVAQTVKSLPAMEETWVGSPAGALRYRTWVQSWSSAALAARSVLPSNRSLAGHKRRIPLAVVLPRPARGAGTLMPSAQRLVWAAKQPLGNAALGALFA